LNRVEQYGCRLKPHMTRFRIQGGDWEIWSKRRNERCRQKQDSRDQNSSQHDGDDDENDDDNDNDGVVLTVSSVVPSCPT
jgi:hypothetical protein